MVKSIQLAGGRVLAVTALGGLAGLGVAGSAVPAPHGSAGRPVTAAWLYAVSAWSGADVWAVGGFAHAGGAAPLVEHWNGRTWRPMHAGLNNEFDVVDFSGVAATSPGGAWAAGGYFSQYAFPLVDHRGGHRWTQDYSVPILGADGGDAWLNGVAAASRKEAWAVGAVGTESLATKTLILAWKGQRHGWNQVPSPSPAGSGSVADSELQAVAAVSPADAWAVGYANTGRSPARRWATLIEHWNGTKWTTVPSPDPSRGRCANDRLFGVAASRAGTWAVGSSCRAPLILRLKDGQWRQVRSPRPAGTPAQLSSVAVTSKTNAWAVGSAGGRVLILHWNGTTWARVKAPGPAGATSAVLAGVSAVSRSVAWAVGQADYPHHVQRLLIERWTGIRWKLVPVPNPPSRPGTSGTIGAG